MSIADNNLCIDVTAFGSRDKVLHRIYLLGAINVLPADDNRPIDEVTKQLEKFGHWYESTLFSCQSVAHTTAPAARTYQSYRQDIAGLLILYPQYMIHILECSEDTLVLHLKNILAHMEVDDSKLKRVVVLTVTHGIQHRLFDEWRACSVTTSPRHEPVDHLLDMDITEHQVITCAKQCIRQLVTLCVNLKRRNQASREHTLAHLSEKLGEWLISEQSLQVLLYQGAPADQDEQREQEEQDGATQQQDSCVLNVQQFINIYYSPLALVDENERSWPMPDQFYVY